MSAKNFVVSVNSASDSINISGIMDGGFGKNIMDIIISINNSSGNFEEAKKNKISCIQDYIYKNMKHIDFLIYLYGQSLVINDYIKRFGPIVYSPVLEVDFATIIIDNIIVIYEVCHFPENIIAATQTTSTQASPSSLSLSYPQSPLSPLLTPSSLSSFTDI